MKRNGEISVFRYARSAMPGAEPTLSNLGGITFLFRFTNPGDQLSFTFAVCNPAENFSKDEGRRICEEEFRLGRQIAVPYDRHVPLVQNALNFLRSAPALSRREKILLEQLEAILGGAPEFPRG